MHKFFYLHTLLYTPDKNNFILDFELTPANVNDSVAFDSIYEKVTKRFPKIKIVTMDAGYKTPWICKKVFDDGRKPSLPYKRPMTKKGFFKSYEYVYDEYYNCVICPNNQVLKYTTTNRDGYREFKSNPHICKSCPYLSQCTNSNTHQKLVTKHIWNDYLELAEDFRHSSLDQWSYSLRSTTIERIFADAKEKFSMRFTYFRGLSQVSNWVRLKFSAMNLKKLALWNWKSIHNAYSLIIFSHYYLLFRQAEADITLIKSNISL